MSGVGEFSGTSLVGSYRPVRVLDGAGRVHEARHDRVPGRFVIKLFANVDARAFQRGAQQAAALRHPGIVRVVDYGMAAGRAFVVMEWAEGRSLFALLGERGPLEPDTVARIVDGVAHGLQAAHRQGVAHGHLSPARVFVSVGGAASEDETPAAERTKILGFGLGPAGALAAGVNVTEVTPYTPPEQLDGEPSPRADQYALAAVAYELLTGEPPAADALLGRPPRSIREYDPTLNVVIDDVVQRGLSFDPGARWPDVHTFAARLREAVYSEAALEERTRLAPLPLTMTKPGPATPTPIELPPVIASVDVDLGTPAPSRRLVPHELPLTKVSAQGVIPMNPPSARHQPFADPLQMPGRLPSTRSGARGPAPPHYGIRPTPTFSFVDEPQLEPPSKRRRRRSGGGVGLLMLVIAAGVGGYLAVEKRVWQQAEPLVARAKDLGRSLRTLAPGASPESSTAAAPEAVPSTGANAAGARPASGGSAPAAAAAATPALHPEVVPIEPALAPKGASAHHGSRSHHATEGTDGAARTDRPEHADRPAHADHSAHAGRARGSRRLSDEAATEEALLAPP